MSRAANPHAPKIPSPLRNEARVFSTGTPSPLFFSPRSPTSSPPSLYYSNAGSTETFESFFDFNDDSQDGNIGLDLDYAIFPEGYSPPRRRSISSSARIASSQAISEPASSIAFAPEILEPESSQAISEPTSSPSLPDPAPTGENNAPRPPENNHYRAIAALTSGAVATAIYFRITEKIRQKAEERIKATQPPSSTRNTKIEKLQKELNIRSKL